MRAIFLDRDGVICKNRSDHVKNWQEFEFLPQAKESLAALAKLGLPIIIVTNQAVVGRGIVTDAVIQDIHQRMVAEVAKCGGRIDSIYYSPHRPEDNSSFRKPGSGMLLQAAQEMEINLAESYMVGDAMTDLQAGQAVGCQTFLVLTGRGRQQLLPALRAVGCNFTLTQNLAGAVAHIFKVEAKLSQGIHPSIYSPLSQPLGVGSRP